jgi:polygalacturonase
VSVQGSDITIEGVVLRDSPVWTVPIRRSDRVMVHNVKVLGYRANSDGIDICNSRDVEVADCFLRTLDDLVVIKTNEGQGKSERITTRRCVLWNQVAHALSVGAELREDVSDVLFSDCDVIHDTGREWTLRVFHCDAALISNIRFEKIRIEESKRAASVWIGKASWSRDAERGHVRDVVFQDIAIGPANPPIELRGFDADHRVENTTFRRVTVGGHPLTRSMVKTNEFVAGVKVEP